MARDIWIAATRDTARARIPPATFARGERRQALALAASWRSRPPVDHIPPVDPAPPAATMRRARTARA